jgi:hypothetical protein
MCPGGSTESSTNNIGTRELRITGGLKFENCHFTVTAAKENKWVHVRFFLWSAWRIYNIISFRVKVLFVLSLEIEYRDEVEVSNWANHKNSHFYS